MSTYLIYDTFQLAHGRADAEGITKGLAYHTHGAPHITRYLSYPRETASGQWALPVDGYDLTTEEQAAVVTEVEWPEEEQP